MIHEFFNPKPFLTQRQGNTLQIGAVILFDLYVGWLTHFGQLNHDAHDLFWWGIGASLFCLVMIRIIWSNKYDQSPTWMKWALGVVLLLYSFHREIGTLLLSM